MLKFTFLVPVLVHNLLPSTFLEVKSLKSTYGLGCISPGGFKGRIPFLPFVSFQMPLQFLAHCPLHHSDLLLLRLGGHSLLIKDHVREMPFFIRGLERLERTAVDHVQQPRSFLLLPGTAAFFSGCLSNARGSSLKCFPSS